LYVGGRHDTRDTCNPGGIDLSSSRLAPVRFPEGFVWGAATSAYQVEGEVEADGRGVSIWDTFCRLPGAIARGESGEIAADHFRRYRGDVALMRDIGLRAYRFSVAWPRIQPTGRDHPNPAGLDFYSRLVDALLDAGIEPVPVLYHWDLPQALQDQGGWPERETAHRFAEYAQIVFHALHDRVRWWGTINEPWCVAFFGYASGVHAPGEHDASQALRAAHHLLLGHGEATQAMRAMDPRPRIGIPLNLVPTRTVQSPPTDTVRDGVRRIDGLQNRLFLDPLLRGDYPEDVVADMVPFGGLPIQPGDDATIAEPLDWLGVNYYFDRTVEAALEPGPLGSAYPGVSGLREEVGRSDVTDMGWPITPSGLHDVLVELDRTYPSLPPLWVSENGAAFDDPPGADGSIDDARRIDYLAAHIAAVERAIDEGVDIRGYFVWSLLDNFEWADGYAKRFGLIHVDFETQRRTPRRSARWYRAVIRGAQGSASKRAAVRPARSAVARSSHE
jgi:beta-glucosidase